MTVYFLTRQKDVCSLIAESLRTAGYMSELFTELDEFFAVVKVQKAQKVDLLALDYRMFDHELVNPYAILKKEHRTIPLIYYNDPFPEPEERALYWKVKNHEHLGNSFTEEKRIALVPLFQKLQDITNDPLLNQYISLINKPKPYNEEHLLLSSFDVEGFRRNHHIPSSRFKLFLYLYENCGRSFSVENICTYLWNSCTPEKVRTLYSYIHELRVACREENRQTILISRVGKRSYKLTVSMQRAGGGTLLLGASASDYLNTIDKTAVRFKNVDKTYVNKYKSHP